MGYPAQRWTDEELRERDELVARMKATGTTQRELAVAAGMSAGPGQTRISRWIRGEAHLSADQIDRIREYLAAHSVPGAISPGPSAAADDGTPLTAHAMKAALAELRELAGELDEGDKDELQGLARKHRREALGGVVRMMVSATSETVRLRACEIVLERSDGRAIQAVMDLTPKPPAVDEDLIALLQKFAAPAPAIEPANGSATDGESR